MSDNLLSDHGTSRPTNKNNRRGGGKGPRPNREDIDSGSNNPYNALNAISAAEKTTQEDPSSTTDNKEEPPPAHFPTTSAATATAKNQELRAILSTKNAQLRAKDEALADLASDLRKTRSQAAASQRQLDDVKRWLTGVPVDMAALLSTATAAAASRFREPPTTRPEAGAGGFYGGKGDGGDAFRQRTGNPQGAFFESNGTDKNFSMDWDYRGPPPGEDGSGDGVNPQRGGYNNARGGRGGGRGRGRGRGRYRSAAGSDHGSGYGGARGNGTWDNAGQVLAGSWRKGDSGEEGGEAEKQKGNRDD
ncbi:hypothetical protein SLS57_005438 [Botryosphaeria dothidea]